MKLKTLFCFVTLVLCMGVFSIPAFAVNSTDTAPPTLTARIQGDTLRIEVSDADSGVEAVFVNDRRLNYRIDSALELPVADYAGEDKLITLYAMDFAGNKSKIVKLKNPTLPPEEKPFTPAGTGTVLDNATDGDGKEFFTIQTPDENVFYLIIDRQRNADNVYLLNSVTESDLRALAVKDEKVEPAPAPTPEPEPAPTPEPEPKPQRNSLGTTIFILLLAAAGGGAGYYFKIYKPKQQAAQPDEFDEDEEDEDGCDEDYPAEEDLDADDLTDEKAPEKQE